MALLPRSPGVYCFKGKTEVLYVGKAINLRSRVGSHFQKRNWRDSLFADKTERIGYEKTGSEIEALILETKLIKKFRPKYNVQWKDGKNYFYVAVTQEARPRIFLTHQTKQNEPLFKTDFIGPFTDGRAIKNTLRLLRRVFPYYTAKKHGGQPCHYCYLGLCPGPNPAPSEYRKNIRGIRDVLLGRKQKLLEKLRREMMLEAEKENFEKAAKIKNLVFSLESVLAHARVFGAAFLPKNNDWKEAQEVLRGILKPGKPILRIEAYDVANIQGKEATGSMVVFIQGRPDNNQYRQFRIKIGAEPNDVAMLVETLQRRFKHPEWPLAQVLLIDGGQAQLNAAVSVKNKLALSSIKVVSLAKKHNELFVEGQKKPVLLKNLGQPVFKLILSLRDEAHRFARRYHFLLRRKRFLPQSN